MISGRNILHIFYVSNVRDIVLLSTSILTPKVDPFFPPKRIQARRNVSYQYINCL